MHIHTVSLLVPCCVTQMLSERLSFVSLPASGKWGLFRFNRLISLCFFLLKYISSDREKVFSPLYKWLTPEFLSYLAHQRKMLQLINLFKECRSNCITHKTISVKRKQNYMHFLFLFSFEGKPNIYNRLLLALIFFLFTGSDTIHHCADIHFNLIQFIYIVPNYNKSSLLGL